MNVVQFRRSLVQEKDTASWDLLHWMLAPLFSEKNLNVSHNCLQWKISVLMCQITKRRQKGDFHVPPVNLRPKQRSLCVQISDNVSVGPIVSPRAVSLKCVALLRVVVTSLPHRTVLDTAVPWACSNLSTILKKRVSIQHILQSWEVTLSAVQDLSRHSSCVEWEILFFTWSQMGSENEFKVPIAQFAHNHWSLNKPSDAKRSLCVWSARTPDTCDEGSSLEETIISKASGGSWLQANVYLWRDERNT